MRTGCPISSDSLIQALRSFRSMHQESSRTGFQGLRVGALESRMASEMERLIARHGGIPIVAPSMQEVPLSEHSQALAFGETLVSGNIDLVVFLTGAGCRTLLDILETQYSRETLQDALENVTIVTRGPKPGGVIKSYGLQPHIQVPEPNTWRDILDALDNSYPKGLAEKKVAVQEYGVSNPELLEKLRQRGAAVAPIPIYKWTMPDDTQPLKELAEQILKGEIPVLLITNAVQIDHLVKIVKEEFSINQLEPSLRKMMVASIGPLASERLRHHGFPVDLEPSHPKMGILVKESSQQAHPILATKRQSF